jgi:hypothetical protein
MQSSYHMPQGFAPLSRTLRHLEIQGFSLPLGAVEGGGEVGRRLEDGGAWCVCAMHGGVLCSPERCGACMQSQQCLNKNTSGYTRLVGCRCSKWPRSLGAVARRRGQSVGMQHGLALLVLGRGCGGEAPATTLLSSPHPSTNSIRSTRVRCA